jgi:hypothetical protein
MGFGGLLELKYGQMYLNICKEWAKWFDTRNRQLVIGEISIQIIARDIHFVLCVPIGSKDFDIENNVKLVNDIKFFKGRDANTLEYFIKQGMSDDSFRRAFILVALVKGLG